MSVGAHSRADHNSTRRADLDAVRLRGSESPWFNLSFDLMHPDEPSERQALVVSLIAEWLYSSKFSGSKNIGKKTIDQSPQRNCFLGGCPIPSDLVIVKVMS